MKESKAILCLLAIILFFGVINSAFAAEVITETEKSLAIETIKGYQGVIDAAISQNGKEVNLAIIVSDRTSEAYAKQLGENFLRLVKTYSKDSPPKKEIGKGIFHYLVGIYTPSKKLIVMGAKDGNATRISW